MNYSIIVKQGNSILYEDQGTTEDGCNKFSSTGSSGDLIFQTILDPGIDSDTTLYTKPLGNVVWEGVFLFSIGTFAVAYLETGLRNKIKTKIENKPKQEPPEVQKLQPIENQGVWQNPLRPK